MVTSERDSTPPQGLCVIPARGGSKRLPRKNLALLDGLSLVQRSLETAVASRLFKTILLSSDDEEILAQAAPYCPKVQAIKRDPSLAGDHSTVLELVCNLVDHYAEGHDMVGLVLPTAPLCSAEHLREGYKLLMSHTNADGVVSLTKYEFPPQFAVALQRSFVTPFMEDSPLVSGKTRSQDQALLYRPNGAFYFHRLPAFLEHQNFWKGSILGYIMSRRDSVDIDTEFDLRLAELMLAEPEA